MKQVRNTNHDKIGNKDRSMRAHIELQSYRLTGFSRSPACLLALAGAFVFLIFQIILWNGTPTQSSVKTTEYSLQDFKWPAAVVLNGNPSKSKATLPREYPNNATNLFTCDLPSLRYGCDMNSKVGCQAYPQLFAIGDLINNWSPEEPSPPSTTFASICRFNISSPYEFELAKVFRQMEVPFVAYGIPELDRASKTWTHEYLTEKLTSDEAYVVHVTKTSHYMYHDQMGSFEEDSLPYKEQMLTYPAFLDLISKAASTTGSPFYYLLLHNSDISNFSSFIHEDLSFFDPYVVASSANPYGDFFLRDPEWADEFGIMVRNGMKGIVTEGHVDASLNMVAMVRGAKRYIIAPPSSCHCLDILENGPSARHTNTNWSDYHSLSESQKACQVTEVVLRAGEVLYLPSVWYHHITALEESIQANARSGLIIRPEMEHYMATCGLAD